MPSTKTPGTIGAELFIVVSLCMHHRRVVRAPKCQACILARTTDSFDNCPWCVFINRNNGGPKFSLVPGIWEFCQSCQGTGLNGIPIGMQAHRGLEVEPD
jgi:hypothetical protein